MSFRSWLPPLAERGGLCQWASNNLLVTEMCKLRPTGLEMYQAVRAGHEIPCSTSSQGLQLLEYISHSYFPPYSRQVGIFS